MSYTLPSAEVAADFRDALQDLKVNSRPEISNLTIIAKENTEHAQAISRELEEHIRTTRPEWKLPALYVLDSIVKNVGTPYTVYLSRNLFRTFMDAYTLMDMQTRKAMEGLLKTWKQPVPESMDTRPVFPAEVTREIENALIKYKTITIQHQQQQQPRSKPMHAVPPRPAQGDPWRNTPTPPQNGPFYSPPNDPRLRQSTPQQQPAQYPQSGSANSTPNPGINAQDVGAPVDLNKLLVDVANLIESTKTEIITDVGNASIRSKLQVLQALQTRLKSGDVSPAHLKTVQDHVAGLTGTPRTTPKPAPVQTFPPFAPSNNPSLPQFPQISVSPQPPQPSPTPPQLPFAPPSIANLATLPVPNVQPATINLVELLRQNAASAPPSSVPSAPPPAPPPATASLADILRQFANPQANAAPPVVPVPQPPPQVPPAIPNSLLEALRAQNLLPNLAPSAPTYSGSAEPTVAILPSAPLDRAIGPAAQMENDVELSTASITKRPRPHLVESLYGALPNQCTTCGRRFSNSPKGKQMKSRHMDWHFKVKDPDISKRGIHRSWYISEREWIAFREQDDAIVGPEGDGAPGGGTSKYGAKRKPAKERYIHVPTEPHLVNAPCPICQEKFDPQWSVEANDFVWMDAVRVNGRIYHATCWEEINRGPSADALRSATPDSVLGKRKAEDNEHESIKAKLR